MLKHGRPLCSNHNSTSHIHTTCTQAKWTTILYVIDCKQSESQDNIHDLHQAWQILQADGAHDKHRGEAGRGKEEKEGLCVSVFELYTHVCSG